MSQTWPDLAGRFEGEAHVLLIERAGTPNTGSAGGERTVEPVPLERA